MGKSEWTLLSISNVFNFKGSDYFKNRDSQNIENKELESISQYFPFNLQIQKWCQQNLEKKWV